MDLDHGFYRIANWISFGAYAHRTHHENPKHFNPSLKMRGNEKTVRMQEAKPPAAACPVPVLLEVQSNRAI
jgi:hypothetical protein